MFARVRCAECFLDSFVNPLYLSRWGLRREPNIVGKRADHYKKKCTKNHGLLGGACARSAVVDDK